jgi:nitrite reductase/ring-hydroxylating ferredoxin subunit
MGEEAHVASSVPRRQALCGVIALGVLGPAALTACSKEQSFGQPSSGSSSGGKATGAPPPAGGAALAQVSQVPVGGGFVATAPDGRKIVISQPTAGVYKAFDARCTHQGVIVGAPVGGTITCPAHGSKFSAADGSVTNPPAQAPLAAVNVQVSGQNIVLA